jgi:RNA polymerase sigma-70 factor (ECF subfamily)
MKESDYKEQFLKIVSDYQGIIFKVSLVYFRNEQDRKDNFQEVLFQLWKAFPSLQNRNSIGSWIYAIAINTSISRIRKNSKIEIRNSLPETIDLADPHCQFIKQEEQNQLIEAIRNLNPIEKSVILLYLEEKSYEEIAEILGITISNAGVRINRIKEKLKNAINHGNK